MTSTETRDDLNDASAWTGVPTMHRGLPVVGRRAEVRGMEGGLNKGVTVQTIPDGTDDVFFTGKARPKGERYDYVCKTDKGAWRSYGPEDDEPEGVICVRIFVSLFAMFADADVVGESVHEAMEAAAQAEALRTEGQQSLDTDPTLTIDELNGLKKILIEASVPDTEEDRHAYLVKVLGEMPKALHQSHLRAIMLDLEG